MAADLTDRLPPPRPRRDLRTLRAVVAREMALRHRGAALGVLWPLLDPLLLVGAYALVLGGVLHVGAPGEARSLAAGLLPWSFLAASWAGCATAFPASAGMLRSLNVEPVLFALAPALATLPGFLLGAALAALLWGAPAPALAVLLALHLVTVLAGGLLLALASLRLPDLVPAVGPALRLLFFVTPVLYPLTRLPPEVRRLAALHPLAPLFSAWRAVLAEARSPSPEVWGAALAWSLVLLALAGAAYARGSRRVAALA